ncbi:MAG: chemotaxis protein CheW [Elainellaceae cyanobacterium]
MAKTSLNRDLERQKFITFPLSDYYVALPMESVLRVLRHDLEGGDDKLNRMGLLQIGRHVIRVINLYQWLTPAPAPPPPFLIIVQPPQGEPFGIWTDGLPDLIELSPNLLRSLPRSAGALSGFLELMSHTVVLADGEENKTIFFLNISRLLEARAPEMAALPSQV